MAQVKAQIVENGVARDVFIDPNKDWLAIRFTREERAVIANLGDNELFLVAPNATLVGNRARLVEWAKQWRTRFYTGSHKAPSGAILLPNMEVKNQDGNS